MTPCSGPASGDDRRLRELADFLRDRRGRLDPTQFGLAARQRKRTPGLRREDVAERAAVSVAWYTSLEQARPVKPSRNVVSSLADALCLDDADRIHLFQLAGHTPPAIARSTAPDTALLQSLVDLLDAPAYCTDALTNVIAWNTAACENFGDYAGWPSERRNLLTLLFNETGFAKRLVDRDNYADRVVQTFRGRSDAYLNDPNAIDMIEALSRSSPAFKARWDRHDVRRTDTDTLHVNHPHGTMTFTMVMWQAVASPGVRFSAYLPSHSGRG